MIPGRRYGPDEWLSALWARRTVVFVCTLLATTGTVAFVSRLPNRFRSETVILTVPQGVPQEYVRATVTAQARDRLSSLSQQILSRTRLERIVRDFNLYAEARRGFKPMDAIVELMRKNIQVDVVPGSESFRVSYEADDPDLAMRVTDRLAGLFIEENMHDREAQAHATSTFLEGQLEDARRSLVEQEKRLEAYRLRYGPELPTQLQSNMQAIQSTQSQIQSIDESLNRDREQRLLEERQLADLQAEQFQAEPSSGGASLGQQIPTSSAQLEAAKAELRAAERRLSPQHPDVIELKQRAADLEKKVQEEAAASASSTPRSTPMTQAELNKRNRIRELKIELEARDRQITKKLADQADLRSALQAYRGRVDALPTRESELAALTRDYDTLQTLYRTLLTKKEDSKVAEKLEQRQIGEQFKIIDPPHPPQRPFSPNRRLLDLGGAIGGLALGLALAGLREYRDRTLRTEDDVHAALEAPTLVVIPRLLTGRDRRWTYVRRAGVSVALVTMSAACGAIMWFTFRT